MARPRSFDEAETLQNVMMVFWRHGYDATTYRMLEKATGLRAKSLVNVFGDKDALFIKILRIYRDKAAGVIAQVFDPPSIDAVETLFEALCRKTDSPDDVANAGCLMVNTVFELGKTSESVRQEVDTYRELWRATFERALSTSGIAEPVERAEFLVGALWGALSQIRLTGKTEAAAPLASVVIDTVKGWR